MHPARTLAGIGGPVLILASVLALPGSLHAQQAPDSLRIEVARLAALVDSLSREVDRLRTTGQEEEAQDALTRLRAAAAAAATATGAPPTRAPDQDANFEGRQRSLQALNPEISLNADVFGFVNPDDADADNFVPREFELSLQSSLDPYSRAKVFLARHAVGPEIVPFDEGEGGHAHADEEDAHGGGFEVEEGYVEWVSLPGGVGLKLGKFQQRFGILNRWHSHALQFQSRSLPHLAFLGEEALAQTGASVSWLVPAGGDAVGTWEATVEVTRSENEALFGESTRPSVLGHVNGFWQLGSSTDLDIGVSWINGSYETETEFFDRNAYTAEMSFNWIPPERSRDAGLNIRGGFLKLDGLVAPIDGTPDQAASEAASAWGAWSSAELRLSQSWLVGGRFDWAQSPYEPDVTQWLVSPTLTWWQSEFVRLRAEYDFLSGIEGGDATGLFMIQVTFAMGPHKHATY